MVPRMSMMSMVSRVSVMSFDIFNTDRR